jgi:hypothetical protein
MTADTTQRDDGQQDDEFLDRIDALRVLRASTPAALAIPIVVSVVFV